VMVRCSICCRIEQGKRIIRSAWAREGKGKRRGGSGVPGRAGIERRSPQTQRIPTRNFVDLGTFRLERKR
jgi:hypothetical protein